MIKKRLVCIALLLAVILSVTAVSVHASNHSDTYFYDITVPRGTFSAMIPHRSKTDTTPVYLKIINVYYSMVNVNVQAVGLDFPITDEPITVENMTYSNGQIVNSVSVYEGMDYLVRSLIYERGYRLASLRFMTGLGHSTTIFEGKWSPDSVGSYQYAE